MRHATAPFGKREGGADRTGGGPPTFISFGSTRGASGGSRRESHERAQGHESEGDPERVGDVGRLTARMGAKAELFGEQTEIGIARQAASRLEPGEIAIGHDIAEG